MKIKRILLLITLFVSCSTLLKAQKFTYGFQAGFDISSTTEIREPVSESLDEILNTDDLNQPLITYNYNAYVGYKSESFWGFSIEPGFMQKGWKYDNVFNVGATTKVHLNYFQLPLLANFYLNEKISFSIGPELSYLINVKALTKESTVNISNSIYTKLEISGIIGMNYNLFEKLDVGARYNHGLTPIIDVEFFDQQGNQTSSKYNQYNQYAQFYVRYKI